jgi:hypothetical protein
MSLVSDDRVRALMPLGFSERQTRFLASVALHSGFCLRRHYTAFAGLAYGQGVRDFLERLVTRRLARRIRFRRDRGFVYHLYATYLYRALGQDDNRNRRQTSPALIARKLMLLDYVLAHPYLDWVATEQDKVALFTRRFGLAPADLPCRSYHARVDTRRPLGLTTRHFIHKLPIAVTGDPPVVTFVYLVTDTSGRGFAEFVHDHQRLFSRLPRWRLVAVAPRHVPGLPACETAWRRLGQTAVGPRPANELEALRACMQVLEAVETGDFRPVSVPAIDVFRASSPRFGEPLLRALHGRWKTDGDRALVDRGTARFVRALDAGHGELVTYCLPQRYDRFGSLAGVA